ncbi:MAG: N-acetyltransferase family protein [Myxococcota bacterium]
MTSRPDIRPFDPHDWETLRDLRLRALADAPDAFARTLAEEQGLSDEDWARRLSEASSTAWQLSAVAEREGKPVGLAYGRLEAEGSSRAHLYSMWVAPEARRSGVGRAIVQAVASWARGAGARCLELRVTESNAAAVRLYASQGFRSTSERSPLREGSPLLVRTLRLDL